MRETLDCADIRRRLRERGLLFDPSIHAHLQACSACAVLLEGGASLGYTLAEATTETEPEISLAEIDAMWTPVEAELGRSPGPIGRLRQTSTRARSLGLIAVATAAAALAFVAMPRVDLDVYPLPRLLGALASLIAAILAAGAIVMRPLHRRPVPGWLLGALAGLALLIPTVIAALPAAHDAHPISRLGTGDDFVPLAVGCFVIGMSFALVLVGAAWLVERSGLRRRATTVLALVGAGALGNLVLVLHCPIVAPIHKLAGHATVSFVLLTIAGGITWAHLPGR